MIFTSIIYPNLFVAPFWFSLETTTEPVEARETPVCCFLELLTKKISDGNVCTMYCPVKNICLAQEPITLFSHSSQLASMECLR